MAHSNRRRVSKIEFNKRIRDLVSRDTNKLRQTFDKFDKEYASRMAEIHSMQEKMRHSMRNLAIDKRNVQETSDRHRRPSHEQKHERNETNSQQTIEQTGMDTRGRRIPKLSVGSYLTNSLEVRATESERRHSLPVYQITNFTLTAKSKQHHNRESQPRASSHTREGLPQFPANYNKAASPSPPQRESPKVSPSLAPKEPFHTNTKSRTRPFRISINGPPVNAVRRISQAYGSPPRTKPRSLDEKKYISREVQNPRVPSRLRSASVCHGLQSVAAIETNSRQSSNSGFRETTKRRRFSVPSNSVAFVDLSSSPSPDVNDVSVSKPRRSSPAIPIPGTRPKDVVDDDVSVDEFDELHHR